MGTQILRCFRIGCSRDSSQVSGVLVVGSEWGNWACSQECADQVLLIPYPLDALPDMQTAQPFFGFFQDGDPLRLENPYLQME